jgi:hypothetical protein
VTFGVQEITFVFHDVAPYVPAINQGPTGFRVEGARDNIVGGLLTKGRTVQARTSVGRERSLLPG